MSEVPTHTITTPNKTKVVFKDWITQGEYETIQSLYLKAERVGDVALDADHLAIELCIVSVGDVTEKDKMVEAVMALPRADAKIVLKEVTQITDPLEETPDEA